MMRHYIIRHYMQRTIARREKANPSWTWREGQADPQDFLDANRPLQVPQLVPAVPGLGRGSGAGTLGTIR